MDYLMYAFRFLINHEFIVLFSVLGMTFYSKKKFTNALTALLFSMIINAALKSIFQVPLKEGLGDHTWAFPSGHMQNVAVVFWGWLAYEIRKVWFYILILTIWIGSGSSLVYFGYHDVFDVLGGLVSGIFLLTLLHYFRKLKFIKQTEQFIGYYLALIGLVIIYFLPKPFCVLWIGMGFFVGMSTASFFVKEYKHNFIQKIIIAAINVAVVFAIIHISKQYYFNLSLKFFITYFAIAFWLIGGFHNRIFKTDSK